MTKKKEVTILLVEDDEIDQKAFKRAFDKMKISNTMVFAEDGVEALEILHSKKGPNIDRPYIVVLDLNMPRMNGQEFLKKIRADKKLRDLVVFVLTTSSDEKDIVSAYDLNVAGYVVKGDVEQSFTKAINMLESYWRIVELPEEG